MKLSWNEPQIIDIPDEIQEGFANAPLIATALIRRGIRGFKQAQEYIYPSFYKSKPPIEFPQLPLAVERILKAIESYERIGIWGDFDVDGQTATAILVECMQSLGADVIYRVPIRGNESHGIDLYKLNEFISKDVKLLITCDTGISANESIDFANSQKVDVIITDHHDIPDDIPNAFAIINPKYFPEEHTLRYLSGAGTAFEVACQLLIIGGKKNSLQALYDLVALGTVADLAELKGDNRFFVQQGILQLRNNQRVGLQQLMKMADLDAKNLTEEHISFSIAPRLNAAGRLGDANPIIQFLITQDTTLAERIAIELEELNWKRKLVVDQIYQAIMRQIEKEESILDSPILVLSNPDWPASVIGIVASRLVKQFYKPVLLFSVDSKRLAHGSARSIEGINISKAISQNSNYLKTYGGHPMAAGVSLEAAQIPAFKRALGKTIESISTDKTFERKLNIDAYVDLNQINREFVDGIELLAPFGQGNPPLTLVCRNVNIKSITTIGATREHLKVVVEDQQGNTNEILFWNGSETPLPKSTFDLAFTARASNFQGKEGVQLEWIDFRESEISTIEISIKYIIHDHRSDPSPLSLLKEILKNKAVIVFGEKLTIPDIEIFNRLQMMKTDYLVIATIPPSMDVLKSIIIKGQPKEIWLMSIKPESENIESFINNLGGLIRYAINHSEGKVSLTTLAAATAQRITIVRKGLEWLSAHGDINLIIGDEDNIQIAIGSETK